MKTYPIMLNVAGRLCVVVGAGPVGMRKAKSLVGAGATVRLVDPDAPDGPRGRGLECLRRAYDPSLLAGATLVFACTDDAHLNARIAADARSAGALVNVADDPDHCDFFTAAVAEDGNVVVAVGTGGASPALAASLKEKLSACLPERVGEFAAALRHARRHVHQRTPDAERRRHVLGKLAGEIGYKAFLEGGVEGLMRLAETALEES